MCKNSLSEVDLVELRDVVASPRPQVVQQAALRHVLRDQTRAPALRKHQTQEPHQVLVLQRPGRVGR